MDITELEGQLADILKKGFDDSFASFCARTLASFDYSPAGRARAKMHAHYLRLALGVMTDPESREELFRPTGEGDDDAFRVVTMESCRAALESDRPFCEVFVEKWCGYYAIPASSLTEAPRG